MEDINRPQILVLLDLFLHYDKFPPFFSSLCILF